MHHTKGAILFNKIDFVVLPRGRRHHNAAGESPRRPSYVRFSALQRAVPDRPDHHRSERKISTFKCLLLSFAILVYFKHLTDPIHSFLGLPLCFVSVANYLQTGQSAPSPFRRLKYGCR